MTFSVVQRKSNGPLEPPVEAPIFERTDRGTIALKVRDTTTGRALREIMRAALDIASYTIDTKSEGAGTYDASWNEPEETVGIEFDASDSELAVGGLYNILAVNRLRSDGPPLTHTMLFKTIDTDAELPKVEYVRDAAGDYVTLDRVARQMAQELTDLS